MVDHLSVGVSWCEKISMHKNGTLTKEIINKGNTKGVREKGD